MKRLVYAEDVKSITLVDDSIGATTASILRHHKIMIYQAGSALTGKKLFAMQSLIIQDKKHDTWGWKTLPIAKTESPFLSLEIGILFKPIDHILDGAVDALQILAALTVFVFLKIVCLHNLNFSYGGDSPVEEAYSFLARKV